MIHYLALPIRFERHHPLRKTKPQLAIDSKHGKYIIGFKDGNIICHKLKAIGMDSELLFDNNNK